MPLPCCVYAALSPLPRRPHAAHWQHCCNASPTQSPHRHNAAASPPKRHPHAALTPPSRCPGPTARSSHAALTQAERLLHAAGTARTLQQRRSNAAATPPALHTALPPLHVALTQQSCLPHAAARSCSLSPRLPPTPPPPSRPSHFTFFNTPALPNAANSPPSRHCTLHWRCPSAAVCSWI